MILFMTLKAWVRGEKEKAKAGARSEGHIF